MSDQFRVLVIDDDPGIREYLQALATRQGYEVFTAADGEEALEKLEDTRPDIVTLDAVLPGMDGLETLRHLKKRVPEVPVIMLSGHGQARTIVEAMRLGASDFLRKPFEVEELELASDVGGYVGDSSDLTWQAAILGVRKTEGYRAKDFAIRNAAWVGANLLIERNLKEDRHEGFLDDLSPYAPVAAEKVEVEDPAEMARGIRAALVDRPAPA